MIQDQAQWLNDILVCKFTAAINPGSDLVFIRLWEGACWRHGTLYNHPCIYQSGELNNITVYCKIGVRLLSAGSMTGYAVRLYQLFYCGKLRSGSSTSFIDCNRSRLPAVLPISHCHRISAFGKVSKNIGCLEITSVKAVLKAGTTTGRNSYAAVIQTGRWIGCCWCDRYIDTAARIRSCSWPVTFAAGKQKCNIAPR